MAIKDQVQQILTARKARATALAQKKEVLAAMKAALHNCDSLYSQAKAIEDEKLREQYVQMFSGLQTKTLQRDIDRLARKIDEGVRRFERDYISIATVGKARQGKSRFLQSVGDLHNDIIPAYDATDCTGATSIIRNAPSMMPGTVSVTVTFRQPADLVEIVKSYISQIWPGYFSEEDPITFDDVGFISLDTLERHVEAGNVNQSTPLEHLTKIVDHFDEIRDLFGKPPLTLTSPERIKTFVAQNNGKAATDPDVEYYYNFLAVERADISCPFYEDCGKIVLVDTVGLGDTKHGIVDSMLQTVDKECDAAIVVTRPISKPQETDLDIYNLLRDNFAGRDISKWLFYLVNRFKGQNDNVVEAFAQEIKNGNYAVAGCHVVDTSDQAAVRDEFLLPMLDTLLSNMDAIDGAYLEQVNEMGRGVLKRYREFLAEMPQVQAFDSTAQVGKEAFEKGKRCFSRLSADLFGQVNFWAGERNKPNTALWNRVQGILNNLDSIIPSAERLQKISDSNGFLSAESVWETALHYTRNEITDRFIAIDGVLEKETRDFKNSLVRHLYYELRALSEGRDTPDEDGEDGDCDMTEWLKTMMDNVISSNGEYQQIYKAFQFLYQFEFNTRAQLIQEIRRQMYIINPICMEYAKPSVTFRKPNCGDEVHFYLSSRLAIIEDELRYALSTLYRTPNMAFYAAAEEFYDRLTFASDLTNDELTSMSDVWGKFFQEFSSRLWASDTNRFKQTDALVKSYNTIRVQLDSLASQIQF